MKTLYASVAGVALAALIGGAGYYILKPQSGDMYAQCGGGQIAGGTATIGGPFTLVSGSGETVTDQDVITKPSLVYFGYTFCPDVCPLDNARNAEAVDLLDEDGHDVTPVFISIDPERDTPEVVAEFAGYMHSKMIGLTGSPEQVRAASKAYRTYYQKQPSDDPDYYLVDHSVYTYLVLPEIGFVEFFGRDVTPEEMAEKTACYIDAAGA